MKQYVIACDEVGYGALAGPITVGGTLSLATMPPTPGWGDSKKLTATQRQAVIERFKAAAGVFRAQHIEACMVDHMGVRAALIWAYDSVIEQLRGECGYIPDSEVSRVIIDGAYLPLNGAGQYEFIPKADATVWQVGVASCGAKEVRDTFMKGLAERHPAYMWHKNKGYGTAQHREAIKSYGLTDYHRRLYCRKLDKGGPVQVDPEPELDVLDLFS